MYISRKFTFTKGSNVKTFQGGETRGIKGVKNTKNFSEWLEAINSLARCTPGGEFVLTNDGTQYTKYFSTKFKPEPVDYWSEMKSKALAAKQVIEANTEGKSESEVRSLVQALVDDEKSYLYTEDEREKLSRKHKVEYDQWVAEAENACSELAEHFTLHGQNLLIAIRSSLGPTTLAEFNSAGVDISNPSGKIAAGIQALTLKYGVADHQATKEIDMCLVKPFDWHMNVDEFFHAKKEMLKLKKSMFEYMKIESVISEKELALSAILNVTNTPSETHITFIRSQIREFEKDKFVDDETFLTLRVEEQERHMCLTSLAAAYKIHQTDYCKKVGKWPPNQTTEYVMGSSSKDGIKTEKPSSKAFCKWCNKDRKHREDDCKFKPEKDSNVYVNESKKNESATSSEERVQKCYNCNSPDHRSYECPHASRCRICGKEGHLSYDWEEKKDSRGRTSDRGGDSSRGRSKSRGRGGYRGGRGGSRGGGVAGGSEGHQSTSNFGHYLVFNPSFPIHKSSRSSETREFYYLMNDNCSDIHILPTELMKYATNLYKVQFDIHGVGSIMAGGMGTMKDCVAHSELFKVTKCLILCGLELDSECAMDSAIYNILSVIVDLLYESRKVKLG